MHRKTTSFICEACEDPTDASGVVCRACQLDRLTSLLDSASWVANARTRTGDLSGETMLDTIVRERRSLTIG